MRRSILAIATTSTVFGFAACNDGPNQTYAPPPNSAAWNDGRAPVGDGGVPAVPGTADNATAPFAGDGGTPIGSGGNNANEICTPAQEAAQNAILNAAPLALPGIAGDLNIAGWSCPNGQAFCGTNALTSWKGLTIEQAEKINCQGTPGADLFGQSGYLDVSWNSGSVVAEYYVPTHKVDYIGVGPGLGGDQYLGTLVMTGLPDASGVTTTYTISVDGVTYITTKDSKGNAGQISNLDWDGAAAGNPASVAIFDTLYRAAFATFLPGVPPEPANQTCNLTGACIIGTFSGQSNAYFFIPAFGWAMWVGYYGSTSGANAINRMDFNFAQIMNFSYANPVLKLDAQGAYTIPFTFPGGQTCSLSLGQSYQDFFNNCVSVAASASDNATEANELFSNISHDEQTISFNVAGVDESFNALERIGATGVVVDPPPPPQSCVTTPDAPGCPQPQDLSFEFSVDQSTLGYIANDWQYSASGSPTIQDLAGAGALYDDYRNIAISQIQQEVCSAQPTNPSCALWFPATGTAPTLAQDIQACIMTFDPTTGNPNPPFTAQSGPAFAAGIPGVLPAGCTGMEQMLSADISTDANGGINYSDPVNIGPIVTEIDPGYALGMKMGHQSAVWCLDAMSINQIAAASTLKIGTAAPVALTAAQVVQIGQLGQGGFLATQPAGAKLTLALPQYCISGNTLPQSENQVINAIANGNETALPIDIQGGQGGTPAPRFFFKSYGLALIQTLEASTGTAQRPYGGLTKSVPQWGPPTVFFGTCASNTDCGGAGTCLGGTCLANMPVQLNDLYFDSNGDGQFEIMEYVDRRFVCPDGANDCAPAGSTGWTCPASTCTVGTTGCAANQGQPNATGTPTCNPNEFAQAPTDLVFVADVKDGIMNNYDVNRLLKRGEAALYTAIQPPGYALAQASNALYSNVFGSALLNAIGGLPPGITDLTGNPLNQSDYSLALSGGTPLSLSFSPTGSGAAPISPIGINATYPGEQQLAFTFPDLTTQGVADVPWTDSSGNVYPDGGCRNNDSCTPGMSCFQHLCYATTAPTVADWTPRQSGNGFREAEYGNSMLDYFVQTASLDFTGITTSGLVDYNVFQPPPSWAPGSDAGYTPVPVTDPMAAGSSLLVQAMAVDSTNYLGDVFMCYEAAANPPVLAVRMYTPTLAILNWLNSVPKSYTDCGMVVRWSPYDNTVNLIESTTYGVRLNVTQGGGLGRVIGAHIYVPGTAVEE
ncbi:MAG: hypothetical protein ACYDCL_14730 [Myxococcales bacterium]